MWDVQKTIKTVFSYSYLKLTKLFGFLSSNVVPVDLSSVAKRLSGLRKLNKVKKLQWNIILFFFS